MVSNLADTSTVKSCLFYRNFICAHLRSAVVLFPSRASLQTLSSAAKYSGQFKYAAVLQVNFARVRTMLDWFVNAQYNPTQTAIHRNQAADDRPSAAAISSFFFPKRTCLRSSASTTGALPNRESSELKPHVTSRKYTAAMRSNRQKMHGAALTLSAGLPIIAGFTLHGEPRV